MCCITVNMKGKLTREQLMTVLYRYAGSPAVNGSITGFNNIAKVSDWAVERQMHGRVAELISAARPQLVEKGRRKAAFLPSRVVKRREIGYGRSG